MYKVLVDILWCLC